MMNVKAMAMMMMMVMASATCFAAEYDEAKIVRDGIANEVASLHALGLERDSFEMGDVAVTTKGNQFKLEADPMQADHVRLVKSTANVRAHYVELFTENKEEDTGYGRVTINGKRVK